MNKCANCGHSIVKLSGKWYHGYIMPLGHIDYSTSCICEGCTNPEPSQSDKKLSED